MEKRQARKYYEGVIISDKMDKTVVVRVEKKIRHPRYEKLVKRFSKFYAHNEQNKAKEGQTVKIMECRPISKLKRFRVVQIKE